jgi:hypothetical protein
VVGVAPLPTACARSRRGHASTELYPGFRGMDEVRFRLHPCHQGCPLRGGASDALEKALAATAGRPRAAPFMAR